jgi:hypothetical protein
MEWDSSDWINLAYDMVKWRTAVITVMNPWFHKKWGISWIAERLLLRKDTVSWSWTVSLLRCLTVGRSIRWIWPLSPFSHNGFDAATIAFMPLLALVYATGLISNSSHWIHRWIPVWNPPPPSPAPALITLFKDSWCSCRNLSCG